jgi:hypothetical protein
MVTCQTIQEAIDLLHYCLGDGEVKHGTHFREELAKEKLSYEDAWGVLLRGRIFDPPEQDIKTGEWKYRIEGREAGGKWVAIIFSFKTIDRAFLITVFSIEARGKNEKG